MMNNYTNALMKSIARRSNTVQAASLAATLNNKQNNAALVAQPQRGFR